MSESNPTRIAFITGANKGIGFEAARQLGIRGINILLGARDKTRGAEAAAKLTDMGVTARPVTIDVTSENSIRAAVADISANERRLDILVNNAGIALAPYKPSELDTAILRETMETNFFGSFNVTKAFLPLLLSSDAGRIVNVSSALGSLAYISDPTWVGSQVQFPAYSISKVALNALTALLSVELRDTKIKINSVEPGYTATDMTGQQGFQTAADAARVIVEYAMIGPDGPTGGYFEYDKKLNW